ncbi:MAG: PPC domain-containing protein [bacterium]
MRRSSKYFGLVAGLGLALGLVACGDDDSGPCGDDLMQITQGEVCDGVDLGGATCQSQGYTGGTLACNDTCDAFDTTACTGGDCGNGVVNSDEQCDGTDLDGTTCVDLGEPNGNLSCNNDCTFNTAGCSSVCGNGVVEPGEDCDLFELDGNDCTTIGQGFAGGDLACTVNCSFNVVDCYMTGVMDVGGPCTQNSDCNGGTCLQEAGPNHWGQAGGYCYENCDANDNCPLSGPDGVCVQFQNGGLCMLACDPANPQCRPGQACENTPGGDVCFWARCTADSECVVTGDCETDSNAENFGWCVSPLENCTNGVDDDFDGKIDCGDTECTGESACPTGEICGNNADDDFDGYTDCDDAECGNLGVCTGAVCVAPATATLTCGASLTGEANDQTGSTDQIEGAECVDPETGNPGAYFANEWGPEYAYSLTVTQPQEVTVTVSNYTGDLDVYIIKQFIGGCDPNNGCFAWGGEMAGVDEVISFTAYPNMTYYVVVDGYEGNVSTYDISVACSSSGYEDCGNGIDDDGDNLVDCDDPECWGVGACSTEVDCGNGIDDDLDGGTDCADLDCAADPECLPGKGYWQLWNRDGSDGEFDLVDQILRFTVNAGNARGYDATRIAGGAWIDAPGSSGASSITLAVADYDNEPVDLPFAFPFQGTDYNRIYVTDNGYVSFTNEAGWMPGPNGWNVYQFARIAPLWTELDPSTGTITYDAWADRVAITWNGLQTSNGTVGNQFQVVMYANGNIEMTWLTVEAVANQPTMTEGMVTMVGADIGTPPAPSDFSTF